jgi:hypothetical protein
MIGIVGIGLTSLIEAMGHWFDWLRFADAAVGQHDASVPRSGSIKWPYQAARRWATGAMLSRVMRWTAHSSFCLSRMAPTSRVMAGSSGKDAYNRSVNCAAPYVVLPHGT